MRKFDINGHEVPLFTLGYIGKILSLTRSGVNKKINENQIPKPNFEDPDNHHRLLSIEDLAIVEYIYKEVWPYKQGVKTPKWVKELIAEAFILSKKLVITNGRSLSPEDWVELDRKYNRFSRYRLQIYIDSWRNRLLGEEEFFSEIVNEDEENIL